MRGRARNKVEPVSLAPRTIEEAPLRRMDRRALNALRKRRADKHMIAFLVIIGIIIVVAGTASIVLWEMFRLNNNISEKSLMSSLLDWITSWSGC